MVFVAYLLLIETVALTFQYDKESNWNLRNRKPGEEIRPYIEATLIEERMNLSPGYNSLSSKGWKTELNRLTAACRLLPKWLAFSAVL
jgi:hypothetical protein